MLGTQQLSPAPLSETELRAMSDEELFYYEDALLLKNELTSKFRIRATGGRFVVFAVSALFFALYLGVMAVLAKGIPEQQRALFTFPGFFLALALGVVTGHLLWKRVGPYPRFWIRSALHYWPVTLYLIALLAFVFKK